MVVESAVLAVCGSTEKKEEVVVWQGEQSKGGRAWWAANRRVYKAGEWQTTQGVVGEGVWCDVCVSHEGRHCVDRTSIAKRRPTATPTPTSPPAST